MKNLVWGKMIEGKINETPKISHKPTITHELAKKPTHEDEKIALVLFLTGGLSYGIFVDELFITILGTSVPKVLCDF